MGIDVNMPTWDPNDHTEVEPQTTTNASDSCVPPPLWTGDPYGTRQVEERGNSGNLSVNDVLEIVPDSLEVTQDPDDPNVLRANIQVRFKGPQNFIRMEFIIDELKSKLADWLDKEWQVPEGALEKD